MAINTENKRRSTLAMAIPALVVLPEPNASILDVRDLPHALGLYAGIGYPGHMLPLKGGLYSDRFFEPSIFPEGIYPDEFFNILNYI